MNKFEYFFCEDQGRYILEISKDNLKKVEAILKKNSVHFDKLGVVTSKEIIIDNEPILSVDELIIKDADIMKSGGGTLEVNDETINDDNLGESERAKVT